jgi:hypothetical protein
MFHRAALGGLILVLLAVGAGAQVFNPANDSLYILTPTAVTFADARAYAASMGGNLVAVNDPGEQAFIATHFGAGSPRLWIGISDELQEGIWVWDSGEPVTYANWCVAQPDDAGSGEDYGEWSPNFVFFCPLGGWNDSPGSQLHRGIVELRLSRRPNGNAYLASSLLGDAFAAQDFAAAVGGHLVTINDGGEADFIDASFNFSGVDEYWIGLSDAANEGAFAWDNGEALTYTDWGPGEPNNDGGEDHALFSTYDFTWNDVPSYIPARALVEIPLTPHLRVRAHAGAGSLAIKNLGGTPGDIFFTALTLTPGAYPYGWFFGLDIGILDLQAQVTSGPPFVGLLDSAGNSAFTIAGGVPPGLSLQLVTVFFSGASGHFNGATWPVGFTTF